LHTIQEDITLLDGGLVLSIFIIWTSGLYNTCGYESVQEIDEINYQHNTLAIVIINEPEQDQVQQKSLTGYFINFTMKSPSSNESVQLPIDEICCNPKGFSHVGESQTAIRFQKLRISFNSHLTYVESVVLG